MRKIIYFAAMALLLPLAAHAYLFHGQGDLETRTLGRQVLEATYSPKGTFLGLLEDGTVWEGGGASYANILATEPLIEGKTYKWVWGGYYGFDEDWRDWATDSTLIFDTSSLIELGVEGPSLEGPEAVPSSVVRAAALKDGTQLVILDCGVMVAMGRAHGSLLEGEQIWLRMLEGQPFGYLIRNLDALPGEPLRIAIAIERASPHFFVVGSL